MHHWYLGLHRLLGHDRRADVLRTLAGGSGGREGAAWYLPGPAGCNHALGGYARLRALAGRDSLDVALFQRGRLGEYRFVRDWASQGTAAAVPQIQPELTFLLVRSFARHLSALPATAN